MLPPSFTGAVKLKSTEVRVAFVGTGGAGCYGVNLESTMVRFAPAGKQFPALPQSIHAWEERERTFKVTVEPM